MNSLGLVDFARANPAVQTLSPEEVAIVRGWYAEQRLSEIGAGIGWHRLRVARRIERLRARGFVLTPRPADFYDKMRRPARG